MLADETARILARRARFGAEALGQRGHPQRQELFLHDLAAHRVGQADLGGGDQPAAVGGMEQVVCELGQLPGAEHRVVAHQQRRIAFHVAVFDRLPVEHELAERPVQSRDAAAQEGEARARNVRADLEIEAQHRPDIGVFARLEIEVAFLAPGGKLDILVFARPIGHILGGDIGNACQQFVKLGADYTRLLFELGEGGRLEVAHLGLQPVGFFRVALAHRLSDRFRGGVAAVLRFLKLGQHRASAAVQVQYPGGDGLCPPAGEPRIEGFGLAADDGDIVHACAYGERAFAWPVSSFGSAAGMCIRAMARWAQRPQWIVRCDQGSGEEARCRFSRKRFRAPLGARHLSIY